MLFFIFRERLNLKKGVVLYRLIPSSVFVREEVRAALQAQGRPEEGLQVHGVQQHGQQTAEEGPSRQEEAASHQDLCCGAA